MSSPNDGFVVIDQKPKCDGCQQICYKFNCLDCNHGLCDDCFKKRPSRICSPKCKRHVSDDRMLVVYQDLCKHWIDGRGIIYEDSDIKDFVFSANLNTKRLSKEAEEGKKTPEEMKPTPDKISDAPSEIKDSGDANNLSFEVIPEDKPEEN